MREKLRIGISFVLGAVLMALLLAPGPVGAQPVSPRPGYALYSTRDGQPALYFRALDRLPWPAKDTQLRYTAYPYKGGWAITIYLPGK